MKKSKFSEEQIAFALRQAEGGTSVPDVCRQMGVSELNFYVWKKYGQLGLNEIREQRAVLHLGSVSPGSVHNRRSGGPPRAPLDDLRSPSWSGANTERPARAVEHGLRARSAVRWTAILHLDRCRSVESREPVTGGRLRDVRSARRRDLGNAHNRHARAGIDCR